MRNSSDEKRTATEPDTYLIQAREKLNRIEGRSDDATPLPIIVYPSSHTLTTVPERMIEPHDSFFCVGLGGALQPGNLVKRSSAGGKISSFVPKMNFGADRSLAEDECGEQQRR
jgi:hypothetical protein